MNRRNRRKDKKKDVPIKFKPSDITQDDIRNFVEARKKESEIYKNVTRVIFNQKIADALKLK